MHNSIIPSSLSRNLASPQVVTGRRPFERIKPDAAVIQKVLSGYRPDRPTVGFSDPLWALLIQTWLEEYEFSPPARPSITDILGRLQDEGKVRGPERLLAPPMQLEQKESRMSSTPPRPA